MQVCAVIQQIPFSMSVYLQMNTLNSMVASRPEISGNLEKSGNFVVLEKSLGIVREFCEIRKSQGISKQNWEKLGNFTCSKRISSKFFQDSFKS